MYYMKKKTRGAAIAAAFALATSMAIGVTTSHAATTLTMIAADYPGDGHTQQDQWNDFATRFHAANPDVTVNVIVKSWNDIDQYVATQIASGQTPDVVNKGDYSAPAAAGLLYPASQIVSPSTLADILPTFLNNSKYNGTVYALPDLASARALFYNKDLLAKAGIKTLPTTWASLQTTLGIIHRKLPGIYGYAIPLGPEEAQAEFNIWAGGNGGVYYDYTAKKWALNSAANIATATYLKGLVSKGYTEPNPEKCDRTACAQALFAAGKAVFINGSVFLGSWLKANGGSKINVGTGSFVAAPKHKPVTLGVQDYFTAYSKNGNQAGIKKWMDFIYQPENYAKFLVAAGGFIPATKSAGAKAASDPALAPFIKLLPNAVFYPGDIASWNAVKGNIQQGIGQSVTGDPTSVLNGLQTQALAAK
jgi:multiple sugar transport system substrate-binding protein